MKTQIGAAAGNRDLKNPVVGTASGNKPVSKIWVGSSGGNRLVWQRVTMTTSMTATPASTTQINLSWTATAGATYRLFRTQGHTTGPLPNVQTALSYSDTGLREGTSYAYRLDVYVGSTLIGSATASAATGVTPPPQFVQKSWTGAAVEATSFTGSNAVRGHSPLYYGYYSSNQGDQKSQVRFAIPAEIRNCHSVDRVELRWWNQHHFANSGGTVSMVAHHNASLGSWGGNTGVLLDNGNQVRWPAPKPGWINGTEWYDLAWLTSAGRYSIAEEIRVHNLQGFGLVAAVGGTSGYGYASADPQLRIHYTVRT